MKSNIVDIYDKERSYFPKHIKNLEKEELCAKKNTELHHIEINTGNIVNGLSNLEYEVLSLIELAPRFTVINVDFKLKE